MTSTAIRDGDKIIITVPVEDAQSLRVALQPCPCRASKSASTAGIRERFVRGLGMALFQKPKRTSATPE